MNDPVHELFGRDAHVTLLALERLDAGELDARARVRVGEHIVGCAHCRARSSAFAAWGEPIAPQGSARSEAGNATVASIVAAAAIAIAATTVLGVGASLMPNPMSAHERAADPLPMAGAYTSVAQEYGEPVVPELELALRDDRADLDVHGDGVLALVVADDDRVAMIVAAPRPVADGATALVLPAGIDRRELVALLCPEPFTLAPGDALPPGPECIVATRGR